MANEFVNLTVAANRCVHNIACEAHALYYYQHRMEDAQKRRAFENIETALAELTAAVEAARPKVPAKKAEAA